MSEIGVVRHLRLEALLAALLQRGSLLACCVIGLGVLAGYSEAASLMPAGTWLVEAGVAIFIALPIIRVLMMVVTFMRERDYVFGLIGILVFLIIALSAAIGLGFARLAA